jgi:glycine/D-amino acid oxidase-like deaminating enzyme
MPHVLLDLARMSYGRPRGEGQVLIGSPLNDAPVVDPDRYDERVDDAYAASARTRMAGRLPAVADVPAAGGQAGLYDMSPDTRAILDRAPGVEGLFIAAGFSGSGFKISPMVGACIAELATAGQARSADIRPFRFMRFAEGEPISGEFEYELPASWGMKW